MKWGRGSRPRRVVAAPPAGEKPAEGEADLGRGWTDTGRYGRRGWRSKNRDWDETERPARRRGKD